MAECTMCGTEIDYRDKFCSNCGALTAIGRPVSERLGRAVAEVAKELSALVGRFTDYVEDESNRKQIIIGGSALALMLVVLTDNPISSGVAGIFDAETKAPQLTTEGLPDFASYEDNFLAEEAEFVVTGTANVRDYPTSQGTQVTRTFSGGERVLAREVRAFDPTAQWFKLSTGGYLWGGNLESIEQVQHEARLAFPASLQGQWADRNSCAGLGRDTTFAISDQEVDFGATRYRLINILAAGNEIPAYELAEPGHPQPSSRDMMLEQDARWPVVWISYGDDVTGKRHRYFRGAVPCSEVMKTAAQM